MNKKRYYIISSLLSIIIFFLVTFNINKYIVIINKVFNKNINDNIFLYIIICSIFALILILTDIAIMLVIYSKKEEIKGIKLKNEDGTFGTANWMTTKEIKSVLGGNESKGLIIGKSNGEMIRLPFDSKFNKNIAVFGSSR